MRINKCLTKVRWIFILGVIATLVNLLFGLVWPPLPIQAGATLPPREPPRSAPDKSDKNDETKSSGAYLELQIQPSQGGLWTVVQWQDSAGGWHDVEGWQGTLDEGNKKIWQVAAADFGKGPFRWAVYQRKGGQLLAISELFHLPHAANETMKIEVSLR